MLLTQSPKNNSESNTEIPPRKEQQRAAIQNCY